MSTPSGGRDPSPRPHQPIRHEQSYPGADGSTSLEQGLNGFDIVEALQLRSIVGPTAMLKNGLGYLEYFDSSRMYFIRPEVHLGAATGTLRAFVNRREWCGWGDWSLVLCRNEAVRALAGDDNDLKGKVGLDLWRFSMGLRFIAIDIEERAEPVDGALQRVDLLVTGLKRTGLGRLVRVSRKYGARVLQRRYA